MGYFIANNNVQQGPFELADLPNHGLTPDSLVWTEAMSDWQRADAVPEIAALLPAVQPVPQPVQVAPAHDLAYHVPVGNPTNGMAIASMVLGIVSIPLACTWGIGFIPAILAIIFGFIARGRVRRGETIFGGGMALAGIILGFVELALTVVFIVIIAIFIATDGLK